MLISVLLPTRNRQEWLTKAVASIIAQTHEDWELIILDNSDEPVRELQDDHRIRYSFVPQEPIASLYNLGLFNARGELVCHFADDDLLPVHALATVAANIGDADWLVAGTEIRNETGQLVTVRGGDKAAVERTRGGEYWLGGAVYWRKTLSDLVGGYDEEYDGAADFDLFLRFLRHSEPAIIPDILYLYTDWPGTDSRQQAARQQWQSARIRQGRP